MLFGMATFGIAFAVGRQAWKQRSGSGSIETSQFKGLEKFVFFWKRMLLTCVNKILVESDPGFSVVYIALFQSGCMFYCFLQWFLTIANI